MTTFARWLKKRRKELGFTQESLAEAIGYSVASIRKLETGIRHPSAELAELLAVQLQIQPSEQTAFIRAARTGISPDTSEAQDAAQIPPTSMAPAAPVSLPVPLTPLIGRDTVVERLCCMLSEEGTRLLTLAGPPGIGKTRLGLEVAARYTGTAEDVGAFFVDLAPINDAALVPAAIAGKVGIKESGDRTLMQLVVDRLGDMRAIVLLDNFEQVVEAAPLISEMLQSCPGIKALVTSREVLRVRGERVFEVPPLEVPSGAGHLSRAGLLNFSAMSLFVERAEAVNPGLELSNEDLEAAASICARLEGLPLAIELVAARTRLFTVKEIEGQLDGRLLGLAGNLRDAPSRQRSLRAAVEWSYNLLDEPERSFFARLGVFVGGCTLSAADAICNAAGDLSAEYTGAGESGVLEYLDSLASKSLLRRERHLGELRFTMLETIREYALERLTEADERGRSELEELRALHSEYYLAMAELAEPQLSGEERKLWLDRLEREHNNLRSALVWAARRPEPEPLARLVASMGQFWLVHRHLDEGKRWLSEVLSRDAASGDPRHLCGLPDRLRARVLLQAGSLSAIQSDYENANAFFTKSVQLLRATGDRWLLAFALHRLSAVMSECGEREKAVKVAQESLAVYTEIGDEKGQADTLNMLGTLNYYSGDQKTGVSQYRQSLALYEELQDKGGISNILNNLGEVARLEGDYALAASLYEQSLVPCREIEDPYSVGISLLNLGFVALHVGDGKRARECFAESLGIFSSSGSKRSIGLGLIGLAGCAVLAGEGARAARLLGAADAVLGAIGTRLADADQEEYARLVALCRALLSDGDWHNRRAEGHRMDVEQATHYALQMH